MPELRLKGLTPRDSPRFGSARQESSCNQTVAKVQAAKHANKTDRPNNNLPPYPPRRQNPLISSSHRAIPKQCPQKAKTQPSRRWSAPERPIPPPSPSSSEASSITASSDVSFGCRGPMSFRSRIERGTQKMQTPQRMQTPPLPSDSKFVKVMEKDKSAEKLVDVLCGKAQDLIRQVQEATDGSSNPVPGMSANPQSELWELKIRMNKMELELDRKRNDAGCDADLNGNLQKEVEALNVQLQATQRQLRDALDQIQILTHRINSQQTYSERDTTDTTGSSYCLSPASSCGSLSSANWGRRRGKPSVSPQRRTYSATALNLSPRGHSASTPCLVNGVPKPYQPIRPIREVSSSTPMLQRTQSMRSPTSERARMQEAQLLLMQRQTAEMQAALQRRCV